MHFSLDLHQRQHRGYKMDIEVQEQKFHQSLDQLIHSTTQLTNTLVSNVVEKFAAIIRENQASLVELHW